MRLPLPTAGRLNALAGSALLLAIGAWTLLAVAFLFVMSLGTDEAWVLNGLRSTIQPIVPDLTTPLIATSGGVFALANFAVEWIADGQVWLHRLLSLGFLACAIAIIVRRALVPGGGLADQALLVVPMLALPAAAEVGTAALGTSAGVMLLAAAIATWTDASKSARWRVVTTGLLYGLAAATRFDLVLFGAALLLCSTLRVSFSEGIRLRLDGAAWMAVALGLAVFLLNLALMKLPANAVAQAGIANATGLAAWDLNYPKLLNQWATLGSFVPVAVLALLSAPVFLSSGGLEAERNGVPRLESLLLATGAVLVAGWLLRAPIPHLRYAWPALFCFAALGSLGLARLLQRFRLEGREDAMLWFRCVAIVIVAASVGSSLRSLVLADSDIVAWEWSNESPHDYYRRFEASTQQQQAAKYVRDLPADAVVYAHLPYAMRYLAQRPMLDIDLLPTGPASTIRSERYLLLGPTVGAYLYLDPAAWEWIAANGQLVSQFGRYSVYRLPAGSDAEMGVLRLARTNFIGHPGAQPWFGRDSLKP